MITMIGATRNVITAAMSLFAPLYFSKLFLSSFSFFRRSFFLFFSRLGTENSGGLADKMLPNLTA